MDAGLLLQNAVVALAVAASVAYVLASRFPGATRRVRGWLAMRLMDIGSPRIASLARRIAPAPRAGGCGSCDGCGS